MSDDKTYAYGTPVLAVCGFSGSGKTTLLEAAIPMLISRGFAIAVVKHDAHGFEVDKPGKDSDRLFRAGATVTLGGPQHQFFRRHQSASLTLEATLMHLACDHDLILVEGHKDTPLPKLWLANSEQAEAPESVTNIISTLAWDDDRLTKFMNYVESWFPTVWMERPLCGGLLIGGMSSRMGSPKQLLQFAGRTLAEIAVEALNAGLGQPGAHGQSVVALGSGLLPASLDEITRLPDSPRYAGPGAGLIAAHRWMPEAAWIMAACDHPWLRREHIAWLVSQRCPGRWAVIPRQSDGHLCPTLALYEPQALEHFAHRALAKRNLRPVALLESPHTAILEPPPELADGWKNVNTPSEMQAAEERFTSSSNEFHGGTK